MKSFLLGLFAILALAFGIAVTMVFIGIVTTSPLKAYQCKHKWEPLPTKYSFNTGCLVKVGDNYVPSSSIRVDLK